MDLEELLGRDVDLMEEGTLHLYFFIPILSSAC